MTPAEALGVAVQVAVAIAGFAGVVVAFRTEAVHQWSATDNFRLRLLPGSSVIPLIVSLFGMFMLAIEPPPAGIWRWGSGFALLIMFPYGFYLGRLTRRIPPGEFPSDAFTRWVFLSARDIAQGDVRFALGDVPDFFVRVGMRLEQRTGRDLVVSKGHVLRVKEATLPAGFRLGRWQRARIDKSHAPFFLRPQKYGK